ncbi:CysZ-like protein [Tsuneonella dongtanensis]|uniref:CysZ-like protein n=1 Tax=Tsuneonella dongtanensis TaxID=692370 RepID=A0A1B2AA80_9SPHN|nr:EI24 domain-containing protein [Tsuneonella dongtanensis]ANY19070.1 CysZ-like protein [Tsuneonella dongtanensis]
MAGVFSSFARALGQLGDGRVLRVLAKSMGVTLAIFAAIGFAAWRGAALAIERYAAGWGEVGGLVALLLAVIGGWLLFRIVALAVLQFFADEVVRAVEVRFYPDEAANARDLPFAEDARNALGGLWRAVLVNALALPVALLLLVTGVGTAILFWAVNAWLLGRELMDMVWLRHRTSPEDAPPLSGLTRFALGGIVAGMLLVPFINLLAPVLGAATATHLVHSRKGRP